MTPPLPKPKPWAATKLQILLPGEVAAPNTATGKTGTPNPQAAGKAFTVTVNAVNDSWNVDTTKSDTVAITASGAATLPANAALVNGTKTFSVTFTGAGSYTVTATDADPAITPGTSPLVTVGAAVSTFSKLQILLPGETAAPNTATGKTGTPRPQTVGVAFPVIINAVDANWNVITTASGDSVGIVTGGSPVPMANKALVAGTATFNVNYTLAGTFTLKAVDATDPSKTDNTSPAIVVSPATTDLPFSKLQILLPGETAAPGTVSGKTGTPTPQTVGVAFTVRVNAVDANWNPETTVNGVSITDVVGLIASGGSPLPLANKALTAGAATFAVTFTAAGSFTLKAVDTVDATKAESLSPPITVTAPSSMYPAGVHPGIGITAYGGSYPSIPNKDKWAVMVCDGQTGAQALALQPTPVKYVYMNACAIQKSTSVSNLGVSIGEATLGGWLLKTSAGAYLPFTRYPDFWLADIGNPAYYQRFALNIYNFAKAWGVNGVWLDNVEIDYRNITGTSNYPINPRTGAVYTQAQWQADSAVAYAYIGRYLQSRGIMLGGNAGAYIAGNVGLPSGVSSNDGSLIKYWWDLLTYPTGTSPRANGGLGVFDHYHLEQWMAHPAAAEVRRLGPEWYNNWNNYQALVAYAQSKGSQLIGQESNSHSTTPTHAQVADYSRASFMLDWNGGYGCSDYWAAPSDGYTVGSMSVDIGLPAGAKFQVLTNVWKRMFTNGYVIVNPTLAPVTVPVTGQVIASGRAVIHQGA